MGAYMSSWFSGPGFAFAFGCFLIFQAFLMGWKNLKKGERAEESLQLHELTYNKPVGIGISVIVGFISSIFGIGGGLIHVPALIYLMGFPTHMATATSHCILAVSTAVGVLTHIMADHVQFYIAIPISIGAIFGAQAGAYISKRLRAKSILIIMSVGVALLGLRLIIFSHVTF